MPLADSRAESAKGVQEGRFLTDSAATPAHTMCDSQFSRRLLWHREYTLSLSINCPCGEFHFNGCCAERRREDVVRPRQLVLAHPAG